MPNDFRPKLLELVETFQKAMEDGELCPHEYLEVASKLCAALETILTGIGDDDDAFNTLVGDVEWAVETYIVPMDLSKYNVPRYLERFVIDPMLPEFVRPALTAIRPEPCEND